MSKARPAAGIAGDAAGAVRAAADRADDQFVDAPSARWARASSARLLLGDPGPALARSSARVPPVRLDDERLHRPAAWRGRRAPAPYLLKLSQPSETSSTAPTLGWVQSALHHPLGIGVGVAAGKADDVHAVLAERQRDLARDMVGAFDEVADGDDVADALAAVRAQPARMVVIGVRLADVARPGRRRRW